MTDIPSTNESPIYQEDKFLLNKLCLESFARTFNRIQAHVVFLCDYCDRRYEVLIKETWKYPCDIIFTSIGINETCLLQYDMASKSSSDTVFFLECDYIWRGTWCSTAMIEGIENLGIVSPYDNLNFYLDPSIHSKAPEIRALGQSHWRTTERNTMTFALPSEVFKENLDLFNKYGYLDSDVWHELRERGHQLWSPIPSLATHMVKNFMAPAIDWERIYGKSESKEI